MTGETILDLLKPLVGKSGSLSLIVSRIGQIGFSANENKKLTAVDLRDDGLSGSSARPGGRSSTQRRSSPWRGPARPRARRASSCEDARLVVDVEQVLLGQKLKPSELRGRGRQRQDLRDQAGPLDDKDVPAGQRLPAVLGPAGAGHDDGVACGQVGQVEVAGDLVWPVLVAALAQLRCGTLSRSCQLMPYRFRGVSRIAFRLLGANCRSI